jgi:hypothetical protein
MLCGGCFHILLGLLCVYLLAGVITGKGILLGRRPKSVGSSKRTRTTISTWLRTRRDRRAGQGTQRKT